MYKRQADSGALPEIRVCYDIANGEVYAELLNTGAKSCTFTVAPQAYRQDAALTLDVAGGGKATRNWGLAASGQWYDFAVTCSSDPAFYLSLIHISSSPPRTAGTCTCAATAACGRATPNCSRRTWTTPP